MLESGGCQLAWFNPIHWYTIGRFNYRTHRKSLIIDGADRLHGRRGHRRPLAGPRKDPAHWRDMQIRIEGPGVIPLQTGFAHNWLQTTGEMVSGPRLLPGGREPPGSVAGPDDTELAGNRRVDRRGRMYYLSIVCARRSILHRQPVLRAGPDGHRRARRSQPDAASTCTIIVSGRHNDNWLARHNSIRLFGPLLEAGVEIFEYNRTMLHHKTMVIDWRLGHDRDDELRQPVVCLQRGEQRVVRRPEAG